MCRRFYNEDECPMYPDCNSCYDPESMDYLYPEEWNKGRLIDAIMMGLFTSHELKRILERRISDEH